MKQAILTVKNWFQKDARREITPLPCLGDYLYKLQEESKKWDYGWSNMLKKRIKYHYLRYKGYFASSNERMLEFLKFIYFFQSRTLDGRIFNRTISEAKEVISKMSKFPKRGKTFYVLFIILIITSIFFAAIFSNNPNNLILIVFTIILASIFILLWSWTTQHKSIFYKSFLDACEEYLNQNINQRNSKKEKSNSAATQLDKELSKNLSFFLGGLLNQKYIEQIGNSKKIKKSKIKKFLSEKTQIAEPSCNKNLTSSDRSDKRYNVFYYMHEFLTKDAEKNNLDEKTIKKLLEKAEGFSNFIIVNFDNYGIIHKWGTDFFKKFLEIFYLSMVTTNNQIAFDNYDSEDLKDIKIKLNNIKSTEDI